MQPTELKAFFKSQIESVRDDYLKDLDAMTHDQLSSKAGGEARSAYDFTYEVAHVNRRLAKRIKGEDPGAWTVEGWVVCPPEYMDKEKARNDIASSMDDVIQAWESVPEGEVNREIVLPSGNKTSPVDLAFMCAYHTGYHDAQLNYIQALQGDGKSHWE